MTKSHSLVRITLLQAPLLHSPFHHTWHNPISTCVGRRWKLCACPLDNLLHPPSILHRRLKFLLKRTRQVLQPIEQLRDVQSWVRPLQSAAQRSASFGEAPSRMGWGHSEHSSAVPLHALWSCYPLSTISCSLTF